MLRMTAPIKQKEFDEFNPACTVRFVINLPICIVYNRNMGWDAYVSYKVPFFYTDVHWSIMRGARTMKDCLSAVDAMIENDYKDKL